jgi:hypothetical protein
MKKSVPNRQGNALTNCCEKHYRIGIIFPFQMGREISCQIGMQPNISNKCESECSNYNIGGFKLSSKKGLFIHLYNCSIISQSTRCNVIISYYSYVCSF